MARFGINDADKYGGQGGGGYFKLVDDKDTATVRFLYDSIEDVEGMSVHEIKEGDKKRYINCLRNYGDPVDVCPLCAKGNVTQVKYFIPLYNVSSGRVEIWERGKKFGQKLASLCSRYPHLVSHTFEIERNGRAGDQQTTYEIYETGQDDTTLEQFELPTIIGTLVQNRTAEEMQNGGGDAPIQRRSDADRRTPNGNRREVF